MFIGMMLHIVHYGICKAAVVTRLTPLSVYVFDEPHGYTFRIEDEVLHEIAKCPEVRAYGGK